MDTSDSSVPGDRDYQSAPIDDLRVQLSDFSEQALGFIRERPLTAVLIAVGGGYLIGRLLR